MDKYGWWEMEISKEVIVSPAKCRRGVLMKKIMGARKTGQTY